VKGRAVKGEGEGGERLWSKRRRRRTVNERKKKEGKEKTERKDGWMRML
jgi:hypothetical protein